MDFFKNFPTVGVDINRDGTIQNMVNIYRSVRPVENFIDSPSLYQKYQIKNGERPDIVSQRLYGSPEYYWTFFVVNEFLHDGYKVWPMSQEMLRDYLDEEYNGMVITTNPSIVRSGDGIITEFRDSLAGRFNIGETITGGDSNASGELTKKLVDMNQLVIQNMTGTFVEEETVVGASSSDSVVSFRVYQYEEAPHHYFIKDADGVERQYHLDTNVDNPYPDNANNDRLQSATIDNVYDPTYATTEALEDEIGIPADRLGKFASELKIKTNRQFVNELNEERSQIRVINPNFIGKFVEEFEKLINE